MSSPPPRSGSPSSPRAVRRSRSRVPQGPVERFTRIGWMAGEVAVGGLLEHARRAVRGGGDDWAASLLTASNAERLARRLSTLRGAAMKLGQLLSLEGDDLLPPEFAGALSVLRADGDAMPKAQLRRVLARAWREDWPRRFSEFEWEPIAAASIGQVHRARLPDGRRLAVKVQFPGIARSIDSDVDNLVRTLRWSRLLPSDVDLTGLATEAKRQLRQEADYETEARHLMRYGALLAGEDAVRVPGVHEALTTRHVLAMDYLEGRPLEDLCGPEHPQERRDRVGALLYRLLLRELFELRFVQSDPNFANFLWLPDTRRVGLVDLGGAHPVDPALAALYRDLIVAAMEDRPGRLRELAHEIGFVTASDDAAQVDGVVRLLELGCEAFGHPGVYDFGASDLPARLRDHALDLAFAKGHRRPPPPKTLFLHRKLAGTFLLCARLRARVALRDIAEPILAGPLAA